MKALLSNFIANKCNEYMTPQYRNTPDRVIYHVIILKFLLAFNIWNEDFERLGTMPRYVNWLLFAIVCSELGFVVSVLVFSVFY